MEKLDKTFCNFKISASTKIGIEEISALHKRRASELTRIIQELLVTEYKKGKTKILLIVEMPNEKNTRGAIYAE